MMNEQDLIVLGGGIVGKTAALALVQKGLKVLHIAPFLESKNTTKNISLAENEWPSRVFAISSSSQALLKDLQVWDAIPQDRIQPVREMRITGDSGLDKDCLNFSAFEGAVPQLAWIIEAEQMECAIDQASRFAQPLQRLQADVIDIQLDKEHVWVKTTEGDFTSKLIIAADGANSPTRNLFNFEIEEEDYSHSAVVANFSCSLPHLQTAYQWFLPGGDVLALLPLPGKRVSLVWSTHHDHAQTLLEIAKNNQEEFCLRISQAAHGHVQKQLGELTLLNETKSYPLKKLQTKHVIGPELDPKIILVGDAAHVIHPLAGQGLNLGLRDIIDLRTVFAEKEGFRKINDAIVLRRYERRRAGDIEALLKLTHHLHQLFLNQSPPFRWLRNTGLRILNQQDFLKQQLIARALG
jgi:ubiquinone biosynthesis UbiH/UbiF/VisC/COQ6 family hydroxylase